jgi:hypothetical protein
MSMKKGSTDFSLCYLHNPDFSDNRVWHRLKSVPLSDRRQEVK